MKLERVMFTLQNQFVLLSRKSLHIHRGGSGRRNNNTRSERMLRIPTNSGVHFVEPVISSRPTCLPIQYVAETLEN